MAKKDVIGEVVCKEDAASIASTYSLAKPCPRSMFSSKFKSYLSGDQMHLMILAAH